jgi:hypothetical protein
MTVPPAVAARRLRLLPGGPAAPTRRRPALGPAAADTDGGQAGADPRPLFVLPRDDNLGGGKGAARPPWPRDVLAFRRASH